MRKLITTIALLALIDTSAAIAQTVGSRNPSAPPPSTNPDKQLLPEAPRPPPTECPQRRTRRMIRTIQSIARTRRLTAWSKAFAAVAKYLRNLREVSDGKLKGTC